MILLVPIEHLLGHAEAFTNYVVEATELRELPPALSTVWLTRLLEAVIDLLRRPGLGEVDLDFVLWQVNQLLGESLAVAARLCDVFRFAEHFLTVPLEEAEHHLHKVTILRDDILLFQLIDDGVPQDVWIKHPFAILLIVIEVNSDREQLILQFYSKLSAWQRGHREHVTNLRLFWLITDALPLHRWVVRVPDCLKLGPLAMLRLNQAIRVELHGQFASKLLILLLL